MSFPRFVGFSNGDNQAAGVLFVYDLTGMIVHCTLSVVKIIYLFLITP